MRRSRHDTADSRARIVEAASRLVRRDGLAATGVAEVMAAAGMTHGGFYRHFASKDALAAEAVAAAFEERARALAPEGKAGAADLRAYVAAYLSPGHVAHPETGCPLAALATEAAHAAPTLQAALADGTGRLAELIAGAAPGDDARAGALRLMASLVGAVAIARGVGDAPLAGEVVEAVLRAPEVETLLAKT